MLPIAWQILPDKTSAWQNFGAKILEGRRRRPTSSGVGATKQVMAAETIAYMRTRGFTPLTDRMVESMGGHLPPVETEFFQEDSMQVVR
jgi:hypothetical protein